MKHDLPPIVIKSSFLRKLLDLKKTKIEIDVDGYFKGKKGKAVKIDRPL